MNEIILLSSFSALAIALVVFAAMVVGKKSLVYSALSLGLLGMANAGLFAFLGYTLIAVFHLAVYIGAAVIFTLFSVAMFRDIPDVEGSSKILAAITISFITLILIYIYLPHFNIPLASQDFKYQELSSLFVGRYWFPLIVTGLALVTTLIEGITLARMEVEEDD
jgi:NADH:ubiquinone oxidoreductase subunit 6 (subunit J)